jgi:hypothetical protein
MANLARSPRVWIVLAFLVTLATASYRLTAQSPPPLSSPFARLVLAAALPEAPFHLRFFTTAVKTDSTAASSRV